MNAPPGTPPTTHPITGTGTNAERAAHRLVRAMKRQGIPPRSATVRALLPVLVAEPFDEWSDGQLAAWLMRAPFARKRTKVRACDPRRDGRRQA